MTTNPLRIALISEALMHPVTLYLRRFHNRTQQPLVPSVSQSVGLQRRGFERLAQLARGVDSQLFNPARRDEALRREWGLGERDIAVLHVDWLAAEKNLSLLGSKLPRAVRRAPTAQATLGDRR